MASRNPAPRLTRRQRVGEFVRRIYEKAGDDEIFFMAGAISFNVLLAIVPLILLVAGLLGYLARARFPDPGGVVVSALQEVLPQSGALEIEPMVRGVVEELLAGRTGLSIVGAVFFIWLSTRLVGSLRTALREIFDVTQTRSIVRGKLFDAQIVAIGGVLLAVNLGVTVVFRAARDFGVDWLGLEGGLVTLGEQLSGFALAFTSLWILLVLVYRYLPTRRVPWRTVLVAASFTAVCLEALKFGFGWYVSTVANFRSTYGNLTTFVLLVFWVYYSAIVFILGGEVGQVYTMRRARRLTAAEDWDAKAGSPT